MAFMKTGAPEKQKPVIDEEIEYVDLMFEDEDETDEEKENEESDSG